MKKNGVPAKSALRRREISHSTRLAACATVFLGIETNVCDGEHFSLDYVYLMIHCFGNSAPLKASTTRCEEIRVSHPTWLAVEASVMPMTIHFWTELTTCTVHASIGCQRT